MTINTKPVHLLFDGTASVTGINATTSKIGMGVSVLQVDNMSGAADVRVQVRLDDLAAWVDHSLLTESSNSQIVTFPDPVNQVRVIGLVTASRVFAQLA